MDIGPESAQDAPAVESVVLRAFATQPGVAGMVSAIRTSGLYEPDLSLVARLEDRVVGYVMISHAELVDGDAHHDVLTLSPLAVDPDHQHRGIGSELVRRVLAAAGRRRDLPRLVTLEGSPAFYGRLGFEFGPDLGVVIDLPDWAPAAAAQVYRLPGYDAAVRGRVRYPPAFGLAEE